MTHTIYVMLIGMVVALLECNGYFKKKQFAFLIWYEAILCLNLLMRDPLYAETTGYLYQMMGVAMTSMIGFYMLRTREYKIAKITLYMLMIMLIVNAVGSAIIDVAFPGSIRAVVTDYHNTGNQKLAYSFYKYGLASYSLPHAIPVIIPILVYSIKVVLEKRLRLFFIIVLAACLALCYFGGSTTALLIGVFAFTISLFTSPKQGGRQVVMFGLFAIIMVIIMSNDDIVLAILEWFDNVIGGEGYFHKKVVDFEYSVMNNDVSDSAVEGRSRLYGMSLDAIIANPIFGTNDDVMGHHSVLLDHWACLGIIGFFPFALFIYHQLKDSYKTIPQNSLYFYIEGCLVGVMMLLVKNTGDWEMWLFLFLLLPLIAQYVGKYQGKETLPNKK